jgi:hypothetical protein
MKFSGPMKLKTTLKTTVYYRENDVDADIYITETSTSDDLLNLCFYKIPKTHILIGRIVGQMDWTVSRVEIEEID